MNNICANTARVFITLYFHLYIFWCLESRKRWSQKFHLIYVMSERWSFLIRKTILSSMFEIIYSHTSIVPQFYCRKICFSKGRISSCWHRSMDKLTNAKRCIHSLLTIRTAHSFTFFYRRKDGDWSISYWKLWN